jgi:hypothetical protein
MLLGRMKIKWDDDDDDDDDVDIAQLRMNNNHKKIYEFNWHKLKICNWKWETAEVDFKFRSINLEYVRQKKIITNWIIFTSEIRAFHQHIDLLISEEKLIKSLCESIMAWFITYWFKFKILTIGMRDKSRYL